MSNWHSVGIVDGANATFVLQQRYNWNFAPNGSGTIMEAQDDHRLVSVTELVDGDDDRFEELKPIDLSDE